MNTYTYKLSKIYFFIWKCERIHILWGVEGIGYGLTKNQARKNSWNIRRW